jgi:hypothetical protein
VCFSSQSQERGPRAKGGYAKRRAGRLLTEELSRFSTSSPSASEVSEPVLSSETIVIFVFSSKKCGQLHPGNNRELLPRSPFLYLSCAFATSKISFKNRILAELLGLSLSLNHEDIACIVISSNFLALRPAS